MRWVRGKFFHSIFFLFSSTFKKCKSQFSSFLLCSCLTLISHLFLFLFTPNCQILASLNSQMMMRRWLNVNSLRDRWMNRAQVETLGTNFSRINKHTKSWTFLNCKSIKKLLESHLDSNMSCLSWKMSLNKFQLHSSLASLPLIVQVSTDNVKISRHLIMLFVDLWKF